MSRHTGSPCSATMHLPQACGDMGDQALAMRSLPPPPPKKHAFRVSRSVTELRMRRPLGRKMPGTACLGKQLDAKSVLQAANLRQPAPLIKLTCLRSKKVSAVIVHA